MPLKYTATEVLQDRWWIGALALGVSLVATPIVRWLAYRAKIVDRPDDLLKPHGRPVAYLGGVAMCMGLLAGLAADITIMPDVARHWESILSDLPRLELWNLADNPLWKVFAIAAAAVLITAVGLLDDLYDLTPRQKILGQVLAAAILLLGGIGQKMAMVVLGPMGLHLPVWLVVSISSVACVILVICTCNATNLLDGLDGLCGGVTGIIAVGYLILAVWLAVWGNFPGTDGLRVAICLAMAGAVLGFLPYNIPPASIFMGDAGSMLLGFFVAVMMAMFCQEGTARWLLAAMGVFALPILDTGLAVARRALSGKGIFSGDRSHLYDQLVDRGMTVQRVVGLFYVLAGGAATVAVLVAIFFRLRYAVVFYAVLGILIVIFFYRLGMITPAPRPPGNAGAGQPPSMDHADAQPK
jgi:UDP-GlcNAc:undecaprenyl-phosphate GlcNAc-1-phosphate transferase